MKNLFVILLIVFIQLANTSTAQNGICNFIGTQYKIRNVVINRTEIHTQGDSVYYENWYKNHESMRLCFYKKNRIKIIWNNYKTKGKYTIEKRKEGTILKIHLKGLNQYDYGIKEKLSHGNFLLELSSISKFILNDCSFVMTIERDGLKRKVFFELVK